MTALHTAIRPAWICAGCGRDWPCLTRRAQLAAEYDRAPVSLSLLMSSYFAAAADELRCAQAGELYGRFLGWLPNGLRRQ